MSICVIPLCSPDGESLGKSELCGEGRFRDKPLPSFRFAKCHLPRRWRPWQRGQVSSSFVNGRRSQPISGKLSALAKASPFRERWHGKAVTERVVSGTNPLSRLRRQLSRRESPWQRGQVSSSFVNGIRSQPISGKLSALAKASPFRERWHGKAVTERVDSGTNPLSRLRRQLSRVGEPLAKRAGLVLICQRQEEVSR